MLETEGANNDPKPNILRLPFSKAGAQNNNNQNPSSHSLTSLTKEVDNYRFKGGYNIQIYGIGRY